MLMKSQHYFVLLCSSHVQDSSALNYVYTELLFHSEYQAGLLIFEKKVSEKWSFMTGNHIYVITRTFVEDINFCIEIFPYHDLGVHLLKSSKVAFF